MEWLTPAPSYVIYILCFLADYKIVPQNITLIS